MSAKPALSIPVDPHRPAWDVLRAAAARIRRGEVIATPTDTLYGLAADPFHPASVERIFRIKRRPETHPILLLIDSAAQLESVCEEPPALFHALASEFWPGPLTMILPATSRVPDAVTAGTGTVAVRRPAAPIPRRLARLAGRPLTGTSANLSGRPAARTAGEVATQLGSSLPLILDGGRSPSTSASTIVDLTGAPRIVRAGVISQARLRRYLP